MRNQWRIVIEAPGTKMAFKGKKSTQYWLIHNVSAVIPKANKLIDRESYYKQSKILDYYMITILLYGSECGIISQLMNRKTKYNSEVVLQNDTMFFIDMVSNTEMLMKWQQHLYSEETAEMYWTHNEERGIG